MLELFENFTVYTCISHCNHHMNRVKSESYMRILIYSEKAFEKTQYPFVIEILKKTSGKVGN